MKRKHENKTAVVIQLEHVKVITLQLVIVNRKQTWNEWNLWV